MGSVVMPVLVALAVALVVLMLSAVASSGRPVRGVLADGRDALRGGLAQVRATATQSQDARPPSHPAAAAWGYDEEDEGSVTDLFTVGRPVQDGYVRVDGLADALEKAQGVVVSGVQQVQHRVRR
ncbi:MAG: hypothetical protein H5T83_07105 [Actinotalea sp.]|nr:hypothetical protein [Actinotalea sp.]